MSNPPMISSSAMPPQVATPMPPGSTSPMNAGVKLQQQQTTGQMNLIGQGKTGGSSRRGRGRGKRRSMRGQKMRGQKMRGRKMSGQKMRGGVGVQVPPVPAGGVNPAATGDNYKDLTTLATNQSSQSVYDGAKTPGDTAAVQAQQIGGSRKRIKGGSWPVWGCLSGGKKSRRKSCKCKRRKNKRTKRHHH